MAIKELNLATWKEIRGRLELLTPDSRPAWGTLNPPGLIEHLNATVLLSLNELPGIVDESRWAVRTFFTPIFHLLPLPRNVKAPASFTPPAATDDLEQLLETLDQTVLRFLKAAEANPRQIGLSPMFGPIPLWRWRKVQYNHFQHHLKQFRLTPPRHPWA